LHQVVSVDFDGSTIREMREIPVPRVVPMLQIPDKAKPIEAVIEELNALDLPESEESARPYLEVRVLIDAPLPDLRARIEAALVDKPVRLARIETRQVMANGDDMSAPASLEDLEHLEPSQIFSRLYQQKYGDTPPKALTSALLELLNAEAEGLQ
jgi:exonuclease SbcD